MCGENEQFVDILCDGFVFDVFKQAFAVSLVAVIRVDRQTGEFARVFFGKRIQRGAAEDDTIVLEYGKTVDFDFQQFPSTPDQDAFRFKWLDQLQNAADIVDSGSAQRLQRFLRNHATDTIVCE